MKETWSVDSFLSCVTSFLSCVTSSARSRQRPGLCTEPFTQSVSEDPSLPSVDGATKNAGPHRRVQ